MRIEVVGDDSISRQARTYAEYRLFAALPYVIDTSRVRQSRLVLQRVTRSRNCDGVSCAVNIELDNGEVLRIKTTAEHPYAAINRTIERLKEDWRPQPDTQVQPEEVASS